MTEIAQIYMGNVDCNTQLAELITTKDCLKVCLKHSDRHKGRIYTHTDNNIAVGIIKSRDRLLQSGDVFQTKSQKLLLIRLQEETILVLDFANVSPDIAPATLVYLGHVLGNHHYPITMDNDKIFVQLITEAEIAEKIIQDCKIAGLQIKYEMKSSMSEDITFSTHSH